MSKAIMADGRYPHPGSGVFPGFPNNSVQQQQHTGFTGIQQQYPMMQQHQRGIMQMQQGAMNQNIQQQMMMQQGMHQQMYRPAGVQGRMNYVPQQQVFRTPMYMAPPAYTPQMAQNYQARQSTPGKPGSQQPVKNVGDEIKKRHFQDTQRKLMQVGRGSQKLGDANSMIDAILGKNEPKAAPKVKVDVNEVKQNDLDDNFGDFIQGPTDDKTEHTPVQEAQEVSPQQKFDNPKPVENSQQKVAPVPEGKPVQISSEIDSSVSDSSNITDRTNAASTVVTAPVNHHQTSHIPPVFYHDAKMPPIYHQVLEASLRDGFIDTGMVYSILIRSNLPRELLGHIWGIANKMQPGQLIKEELFMVLALIALAQGKQDVSSLQIFNIYPEPCIPDLGQQMAPQVPPAPTLSSEVIPPTNPVISSKSSTSQINHDFDTSAQNSDSFGEFVSSPADFKVETKSDEKKEKHSHFPFQSSTQPAGSATKQPANIRPNTIHDDIGGFSKITELANKVTESATILPSPNNNNTSIPFSPSNFIGMMTEIATKRPKSLDGSSIGSFKMDSISQKSLPSSYAIDDDDDDDFDDFKSAESSDNLSGSFANIPPKIDQSTIDPSDKYSVFRTLSSVEKPSEKDSKIDSSVFMSPEESKLNPVIPTKSVDQNDEFSMLKNSNVQKESGNSGVLIDNYSAFKNQISALFASNNDSTPATIPETNKTSTSHIWDEFSSSEATTKDEPNSPGFADFSQFQSADSNGNGGECEKNVFKSVDCKDPEVSDNRTWTENIEKENSEESSTPSSPFGAVGTFSSKRGLQNGKNRSPENSYIELSDGTLREAPPELTFNDEDEEFSDFMSSGTTQAVTASDDSELFTDTRSGVMATDWTAGSRAAKNIRPKILESYNNNYPTKKGKLGLFNSSSSNETNIPATLPVNEAIIGDILADSQSVSSFEFPTKDSSKDLNSLGGDNQSISSVNSADSGKKSNPDQMSVKSLDLKATFYQSPAETPGSMENFGSFSSAEPQQTHIEDSWNQCPRDASDLLSDGVLLDRYSSARNDLMNVERHAFEWERSLKKCLETIQKASDVFNSISSSSVCNEVIKSRQGSDYILGIVEIYRVVKRLSLAMRVSAVTNENLHNLISDIEVSWNSVAAFIQNSSLMPDILSLDFSKCILKSDGDELQHRACGVCLLNVDSRSKAFDREMDKHKLTYGGRQYHVTCANFWINCVDSTLPALRLPELL
ncbi:synergin gamma-like isoform X2 [Tubulanus polymorphus]|uniref:synergin gamma-like isoform X2 n=1 Tax=Tubulanus polymorphus TaxID=672921 RepID=UPI003DA2A020